MGFPASIIEYKTVNFPKVSDYISLITSNKNIRLTTWDKPDVIT